jgi:ABC-type transport system involved in multi-copper enzyme maturation permease subunit
MKRALFLKEWRYLRPFLFLSIALLLVELVDSLLSPIEAHSFSQTVASLHLELAVSQLLLGFALGSGLLVREIDDGTLNFLDGLPLTRAAVFAAKVKAAMLVLAVYPFGVIVWRALLHLGARESLDHALHPSLLLTFFGLCMLATAVSLTLGMLLGYLRYLSWLVLGLCVIGVQLLENSAPSLSAALNTGDLLALRFTGVRWQLPLKTIWTQLGAALLFAALAFGLFKASGARLAPVRKWQKARRWLLAPAVAAMLIAAVAGIVTLARRQASDVEPADREQTHAVHFTPIASGHATTAHFTFSYPALSGERLAPFIKRADQTFTDVAALLRIDSGRGIDVDLSGTTENHEGTAYFDRIRMHVRGAAAMGVLAHETTHVFARRLAGGESGQLLQGMMVFNEGLAEWVENQLTAQGKVSTKHELAAAIVSKRRLVSPRQLTDHAALAAAVDEDLKYPLGAAFVAQFVRRYGAEAPKTLLQTLARADFPRDLDGYVLWQTAFQLSGYDLDLVFDDYARHLKSLEAKYARQIAALPRPRGSLVETDSDYAVALRLDLPLPEDAYPLVRFRPGTVGGSEQYRTSYIETSSSGRMLATVPEEMIIRDELCFQPGLYYGGITVYEPWVCLPVSSASVITDEKG